MLVRVYIGLYAKMGTWPGLGFWVDVFVAWR
jgi:hypothetical protein